MNASRWKKKLVQSRMGVREHVPSIIGSYSTLSASSVIIIARGIHVALLAKDLKPSTTARAKIYESGYREEHKCTFTE